MLPYIDTITTTTILKEDEDGKYYPISSRTGYNTSAESHWHAIAKQIKEDAPTNSVLFPEGNYRVVQVEGGVRGSIHARGANFGIVRPDESTIRFVRI